MKSVLISRFTLEELLHPRLFFFAETISKAILFDPLKITWPQNNVAIRGSHYWIQRGVVDKRKKDQEIAEDWRPSIHCSGTSSRCPRSTTAAFSLRPTIWWKRITTHQVADIPIDYVLIGH
jgi:hypothetical protein